MKKAFGILLALVLLASANVFAEGKKETGKNVTIRVTTRWSDDAPDSKYFRDMIEKYNSLGKGITVVGEHIQNEDSYLDKLRTQFATGTPPNLFIEYGGSRIVDYVAAGALVDYKPYLDKEPAWRDTFLPLWDKWEYKQYPGIYGIPVQFYAVCLYYNKAIFAKLGLNPPTTLDELRDVSAKIKAAGISPFMVGEKDSWRAGHLFNNLVMKSFGAEGVAKLADRSLPYNGPDVVKLFALIKEFNDMGYFGPNAVGVDYNAERTAFLTGQSAMHYNGSWFLGEAASSDLKDSIGVVPFPSINPKYKDSWQGGAADAFSMAKVKDPAQIAASIDFIKFISSQEYYAGREKANMGGAYPVKFQSDPAISNPVNTQFKAAIKDAKEYRDDVQTYDTESHMLETVRLAIQGLFVGKTPQECGDEIVAKIKANQ